MTGDVEKPNDAVASPPKALKPAAERALAEAAARRSELDRKAAEKAGEIGGPKGL
jgi:hypothetical protein